MAQLVDWIDARFPMTRFMKEHDAYVTSRNQIQINRAITALGIDPIFVRIGFVVLSLLNGVGLLLYVALWLIVPNEGSVAAGRVAASPILVTKCARSLGRLSGEPLDEAQLEQHLHGLLDLRRGDGGMDGLGDLRRAVLVLPDGEIVPDHPVIPPGE